MQSADEPTGSNTQKSLTCLIGETSLVLCSAAAQIEKHDHPNQNNQERYGVLQGARFGSNHQNVPRIAITLPIAVARWFLSPTVSRPTQGAYAIPCYLNRTAGNQKRVHFLELRKVPRIQQPGWMGCAAALRPCQENPELGPCVSFPRRAKMLKGSSRETRGVRAFYKRCGLSFILSSGGRAC